MKGFVGDQFVDGEIGQEEITSVKQRLIYHHIAWLYTLRNQLLIPEPWQHISQKKHMVDMTKARMKTFGVGLFEDDKAPELLQSLLSPEEYSELIAYKNTATQIIDRQSDNLSELRRQGLINDFRHVELQKQLNDFYLHFTSLQHDAGAGQIGRSGTLHRHSHQHLGRVDLRYDGIGRRLF